MDATADRATFRVERAATIAGSPERVFAALVDFHEWVHWSPWEGIDANLQRTYTGPASGVGAMYAWRGNRKVGAGSMEIIDADAPSNLVIDLRFLKPFKAHNTTRFAVRGVAEATEVTWTMTGPKTLMSRVMGIFMSMDKFVGRDFEKGLAQLKAHVES